MVCAKIARAKVTRVELTPEPTQYCVPISCIWLTGTAVLERGALVDGLGRIGMVRQAEHHNLRIRSCSFDKNTIFRRWLHATAIRRTQIRTGQVTGRRG